MFRGGESVCYFFMYKFRLRKVQFLGCLVNQVVLVFTRFEAVMRWEVLRSLSEIRNFLVFGVLFSVGSSYVVLWNPRVKVDMNRQFKALYFSYISRWWFES